MADECHLNPLFVIVETCYICYVCIRVWASQAIYSIAIFSTGNANEILINWINYLKL